MASPTTPPSTPPRRSDSLPRAPLPPRSSSLHSAANSPLRSQPNPPSPARSLSSILDVLFSSPQELEIHIELTEQRRRPNHDQRFPDDADVDGNERESWEENEDEDDLKKGGGDLGQQPMMYCPAALNFADAATAQLPNIRLSAHSTSSSAKEPFPANGDSPSASEFSPTSPKKVNIQPTLGLLFSLAPARSHLPILIPALFCTTVAGLLPPYMTELVGAAFGSFTNYAVVLAEAPSADILKAAESTLLSETRLVAIKFACLALVTLLSTGFSLSLWIVHGERVARDLRLEVFKGIGSREMAWFDLGMGADERGEEEDDEEGEIYGEGAGGLMGRFSKETDEVRLACSQSMGLFLQSLISFVACLVLSFVQGWKLTFVILASVPAMLAIVTITERLSAHLGMSDKAQSAKGSARVDRVLGAMTTVKAFNAEEKELDGFKILTAASRRVYLRLHFTWGIRLGMTQFIILGMFVQGFWFGAFLVRKGEQTAAAVNTCFWACVLATSFLQSMIPYLVIIERGKMSMANLLDLSRPSTDAEPVAVLVRPAAESKKFSFRRGQRQSRQKYLPGSPDSAQGPFAVAGVVPPSPNEDGSSPHPFHVTFPSTTTLRSPTPITPTLIPLSSARGPRNKTAPRALRKLRPTSFTGELALKGITFHYPTRPAPASPALRDVSIYIAPADTTYIVGGSGSGKSTVAALLLGLYHAEAGSIEVDEQGLDWIDEKWLRGHVGCVSQGASVLFDGSVHDNVAIGVVGQIQADGSTREAKDVTREEVVAACQGALIHDFVRDLPEGYDTWLSGEKGASLSGGQRQRLAIARAWLRNPTVLIMDEATSALDATSRLLVSEAVKHWRKNQATIVITHDLTPIEADDFVYVMADGEVVEQGYRQDLEGNVGGPFHTMAHSQGPAGPGMEDPDIEELDESDEDFEQLPKSSLLSTPPRQKTADVPYLSPARSDKRKSTSLAVPVESNVFFGAGSGGMLVSPDVTRSTRDLSAARHASAQFESRRSISRRPSFDHRPSFDRRPSFDYRPSLETRPSYDAPPPQYDYSHFSRGGRRDSSMSFTALDYAAKQATNRRVRGTAGRIKHRTMVEGGTLQSEWTAKLHGTDDVAIDVDLPVQRQMTLREVLRAYYPHIPNKSMFWFGLSISVAVGGCTPVFSYLLAKLMTNIGNPDGGAVVLRTSLLVLMIAAIDGSGTFLKFYLLERCAMDWICALRLRAFRLVSKQDKAWLDRPENSTGTLSNMLIKDTEDTRALVGTVAPQLVVVVSMIVIGIVWAFVCGWELTLVGCGLAPVFVIATRLQANVQEKFEGKSKVMRENVSTKFHQNIANIKAIRSMSIEKVFSSKFEAAVQETYLGGRKAAPFSSLGYALGSSLTYVSEALMFYVGAILIIDGKYTFGTMVEVFTLIMFSISFSSQVMTTLPAMAKSLRAAIDFLRLIELPVETQESEGTMKFPIVGRIAFENVEFAYPQRPDARILKRMSFQVNPGECVGFVGASGSGKSTVTTLLQRLYEPDAGQILLDGHPLSSMDCHYLRDHIAVVSQHPALFDMTIADNIAYGSDGISEEEIIAAATKAHVHDFISSLPKGYQTMLGENASLISGGQAQRLQIARALVRHREILILDECTSALDAVNQAAVMETIHAVKAGKTTIIVTHKLNVMKTCDRLFVIGDGGVVAESGTFEELRAMPGGLFASLASQGEWEHA